MDLQGCAAECELCTLVNAPDVDKCEACRTHKMVSEARRAEARREAAADAQARSNIMSAGKKNKRKGGVKMSIQDMNTQSQPQYMWNRGRPSGRQLVQGHGIQTVTFMTQLAGRASKCFYLFQRRDRCSDGARNDGLQFGVIGCCTKQLLTQ
eukprot:TRINITY_DN45674_c0_g1_i1.p1 TRINITY_DN45674_c0_g1~~TRINITY_DN45674_c0_g1_i1.p1  ORF type:complete len:161 (-),score=12.05 TRINITY_DN45674_c0_g1_i1:70-525(-)